MTTPSPAAEAFVNSLPLGVALYRHDIMKAFDLALAEAHRDTERLDWLEKNRMFIRLSYGARILDCDPIRAAIDATMSGDTAQKTP